MAIHLNNMVLAAVDNKNNTKIKCYLDKGDVCGFVFIVARGSGAKNVIFLMASISFLSVQNCSTRCQ